MPAPNFTTGHVVDTGMMVRNLTDAYIHAKPPRVSPVALKPLIAYLETVTQETSAHIDDAAAWLGARPVSETIVAFQELNKIRGLMTAWKLRLAQYRLSVDGCPPEDAACTLWSTVAPLFFGYYDGPEGLDPQRGADLATPFMLANMAGELKQWSTDQLGWTAGWNDVVSSAKGLPVQVVEVVGNTVTMLADQASKAAKGAANVLGLPDLNTILVIAALGVGVWIFMKGRRKDD